MATKAWLRGVAGIGPLVLVIVLIVTNPGEKSLEQILEVQEHAVSGEPMPVAPGGPAQTLYPGKVDCENYGMFSLARVALGAERQRYVGVLGLWIPLGGGERSESESHTHTSLPSPRQQ
ncbi:MAG: hypothetical protein ACM3OB_03835 [Acidobacteriota bacterium]